MKKQTYSNVRGEAERLGCVEASAQLNLHGWAPNIGPGIRLEHERGRGLSSPSGPKSLTQFKIEKSGGCTWRLPVRLPATPALPFCLSLYLLSSTTAATTTRHCFLNGSQRTGRCGDWGGALMRFVSVILSVFFFLLLLKAAHQTPAAVQRKHTPSPTRKDPEITLAPTRKSPFKSINQNIICTLRT